MNALLVTSRITFVPENYDALILGLANNPHIGGLLVIDNLNTALLFKAMGAFFSGAKGIGSTLISNILGKSFKKRMDCYQSLNKPIYLSSSVNRESTKKWIKTGGFDLIINARTRCIYKDEILSLPHYGCINIHHGLLPEQRGTMCDLWSLSHGNEAGFSIHKMTSTIDDGDILYVVKTSEDNETHYLDYLQRTTKKELHTITKLLTNLNKYKTLQGQPNVPKQGNGVNKDPTPKQIKQALKINKRNLVI